MRRLVESGAYPLRSTSAGLHKRLNRPKFVFVLGVPCLRRFVLDLAVRGKLVAQDAGDEPASELLKRIVGSVEELMALLDRLEAARTAREATSDRLTTARLTAPDADPAEFPANARFALATLPALTTRPDQIKPLRQTILNLAVRGKLVEQDPTDKPASELLSRIGVEKARLIKAGKVRKSKSEPLPKEANSTSDLPLGWCLARLDDVANIGYWSNTFKGKAGFLRRRANTLDQQFGHKPKRDQSGRALCYRPCRQRMQVEDLLVRKLGGRALWPGKNRGQVSELGLDATVNQACAVLEWFPAFRELKQYVRLTLEQQYEAMRETAEGGPQPNLNVGKIKSRIVPLPPLAEQHRIVAKVDALMAVCDRLEAALTTADTTRACLLEALLHEALAPATTLATEAAE